MPNPAFNIDIGPCQDCKAYGGVHDNEFGDTICTAPERSGKSVSRMPAIGCSGFQRRPGTMAVAEWHPKHRQ